MSSDTTLNTSFRATVRVYTTAAVDTYKGIRKNLRLLVAHFLLAVVAGILLRIFGGGAGFAGSILLGFIFAFMLAVYLTTVEAAVLQERLPFDAILPRAQVLFSPAISVLFTLFILNFVADRTLVTPESQWLRMMLGLVIAVLFNTLPEAIYLVRGGTLELFGESYNFIKENFLEWLAPWLLLLSPLLFLSGPTAFLNGLILLSTANPIQVLQSAIMIGGRLLVPPYIFFFPLAALIAYFILVFRGNLFKILAGTSRRSRAYQERMR